MALGSIYPQGSVLSIAIARRMEAPEPSPPRRVPCSMHELHAHARASTRAGRAAAAHGGIISYNRANNVWLCVRLGLPWIMSRRLPSHMQFLHGPLLIIWHVTHVHYNL